VPVGKRLGPVGVGTDAACPNGEPTLQVDHGYDAGYLTSLANPTGTDWVTGIEYHPNGLWSQIDRSNGWEDRQTIAGNGMQRPLEIKAQNAAQQVLFTTGPFGYDGAGNVKAMGADSFDYDAQSRLVGGTIDAQGYTFTYDPYGNLSSYGGPTGTVSICIDSEKNRIVDFDDPNPPPPPCPNLKARQDAFGNVIDLQGATYAYDALDMLIQRNPSGKKPEHTYVYTADDERLWFINAGGGPPPGDEGSTPPGFFMTAWEGLFLRDLSGKLLRQYSKQTTFAFAPDDAVYTHPSDVSRDYIHRNGQLAAIQTGTGTITHQHLDHLGTPRALSDASGALVSTHKYTPYGKELGGSSWKALQFTGHERDSHGAGEDDNLDYMHARFYAGHVGRFLSIDPIDSSLPNKPQSWNKYAYTINNPLRYVDPDGEAWRPPEGASQLEIDAALALMGDPGIGPGALAVGPRAGLSLIGRLGLHLAGRQGFAGRVGSSFVRLSVANARASFTGIATQLAEGGAPTAGFASLVEGIAPVTRGGLAAFERQFAQRGAGNLLKSRQSLISRLSEHLGKIERARAAGGLTSSLEREIRTFAQQINAIDQVLAEKGGLVFI